MRLRRSNILRQTGGHTALTFALAAAPILTTIGVGIDFSYATSVRGNIQAAQDAATLSAGTHYMTLTNMTRQQKEAAAETHGRLVFTENLAQGKIKITNPAIVFDFSEVGLIKSVATGKSANVFAGLIGVNYVDVRTEAEVRAGSGKRYEIALMLDNTGSMFDGGRFTIMRGAAKDFVDRMFDAHGKDNVKISVIPWATSVNILSEPIAGPSDAGSAGANPPAAGSRTNPAAPRSNRVGDVIHPETGAAFANKPAVDAIFAPTEWRGCVRAAAGERTVSNSGNVTVPLTDAFPAAKWPVNRVPPRLHRKWYCSPCGGPPPPPPPPGPPKPPPPPPPPPPPGPPPPPPRNPNAFYAPKGPHQPATVNVSFSLWGPYAPDLSRPLSSANGLEAWTRGEDQPAAPTEARAQWHANPNLIDCWQWDENGRANGYVPRPLACSGSQWNQTGTHAACVSDPNEFKYIQNGGAFCHERTSNQVLPWDRMRNINGPNMNCPTAILPLSANRNQVLSKLDHMYPVPGGTHADVGLMWGLRTLSSRSQWRSFWGHNNSNGPADWDDDEVVKIGILLTDGLNTAARDFEGYWGCTRSDRDTGYDDPSTPLTRGPLSVEDDSLGCWRYGTVGRIDTTSIDNMMQDACTQMKDEYGITLYTIMVDINDAGAVQKLTQCASTTEHAFNVNTTSLEGTFNSILGSVMRISR